MEQLTALEVLHKVGGIKFSVQSSPVTQQKQGVWARQDTRSVLDKDNSSELILRSI